MKELTIDYIKNIKIDIENLPVSNIQALDYLRDGIFHIFEFLKKEESLCKEESDFDENGMIPSKHTMLYMLSSSKRSNLILNHFNWFTNSCINYVRIIALLDLMVKNNWRTSDLKSNKDIIRIYCYNYIKEVIPELYDWRNKISAHPSATDPHNNDNIGLLEFSLMNQLSFSYPHYYVGDFQWSTGGESSNIIKWSLVEVFENKMVPRYWPVYKN